MSSTFIKPFTTNNVHKLLYAKQEQQKKTHELTETYDKYREENLKIYKKKCEYFLAGVKQYHNDNYDILIHNKPNVSRRPDLACQCSERLNCGEPAIEKEEESKVTTGEVLRRRSKRYVTEIPETPEKVCGVEPWLKRYLVLSRFIEAVRKIIIRTRLMKRLARLKVILADPLLLRTDASAPLRKEYLSYGELTYKLDQL